jgi:hypothetical protein
MRIPTAAPVVARRPDWLTAGLVRLGILSAFIVAVGMIPLHLTRTSAIVLVCVAAGVAIAVVASFAGALHRMTRALPILERGQRETDWILAQFRHIGLPLLGLALFLAWTFVYVALWAVHPHEAFKGLSPEPRFADFFYYAVSTAFISPPGDVIATSRGARSATMIEMLTAFALLTAYVSSFIDWRGEPARVEDTQPLS